MSQKVKGPEQLREVCLYSLQNTILGKHEEAKQLFCDIFVEMVKRFDIDFYIEIGLPLLLTSIEDCQNKLVKFLTSRICKSYTSKLIDRVEYLVTTFELEVNIVYKALLEHIERKISEFYEKSNDYNEALNKTIKYMKKMKSDIEKKIVVDIVEKSLEDLKVTSILKILVDKHYDYLLGVLGEECLEFIHKAVDKFYRRAYHLAKKQRMY